jgi:hypothetical protein
MDKDNPLEVKMLLTALGLLRGLAQQGKDERIEEAIKQLRKIEKELKL